MASQQQQLKPQFFVTRQNGAMVPLIAMDELPLHVQIQGVSRTLSAFEVTGMTGVGLADSRHQFYVVESLNNTRQIPFTPSIPNSTTNSTAGTPILPTAALAPSAPGKDDTVKVDKTNDTAARASFAPGKDDTIKVEKTNDTNAASGPSTNTSDASGADEHEQKSSRSTTPDTTASGELNMKTPATASPAPLAWRNKDVTTAVPATLDAALTNKSLPAYDPRPEMPAPGEKVYCSYWLRNGECSFTQTGCLYKHVMPIDLQVLDALGLRDLPDWFRKAHGCGSLRINGGRNGLSFGITVADVSGMPGTLAGPRARLDPEASRRMLAAHINSMPLRGNRAATKRPVRTSNPRPAILGAPRVPRVLTEAEKAAQRDSHDKRMAAAFDADLESNACTEMMDAEMERIREKEQAGWEEEQKARLAGKVGEASGSEGSSKEETKAGPASAAASASAEKKKIRSGYGRRSPRRTVKKD
ncbi:hypothetical protein H2200_011706 [Cladophialophora chaetospira]|uniref:C3H1-type domain-containing protein n=1 Tax=Cladophialophora chaetospira TaxID=386627 RepID=A0AA38WYL1_9EURO|nr:hypothetical protein H2200_011706 [Cladophialophora chaetospira]